MATISITKVVNCKYLQNKLKDASLPIKTAYKLAKFFNFVDGESQFYSNKLNQIIEEYGARDENGNLVPTEDGRGIQISRDSLAAAEAKINELMGLEIELPSFTFTLDELEGADLTIEDVQNLEPFITE